MKEAKVSGHKWAWPLRACSLTPVGRLNCFWAVLGCHPPLSWFRWTTSQLPADVSGCRRASAAAAFSWLQHPHQRTGVRGQASEDRRLKSGPQRQCSERKVQEPKFFLKRNVGLKSLLKYSDCLGRKRGVTLTMTSGEAARH